MFYTFYQNDTDGKFLIDENVAEFVIIEANSADEANEKAKLVGIFFSVDSDTWEMAEKWDAESDPMVFDEYPTELNSKDFNTIVYYANGKKEFYKHHPA